MRNKVWYLGCALCLVAAAATAETPEATVSTSITVVSAPEEKGAAVVSPVPIEEKTSVPMVSTSVVEETPVVAAKDPVPVTEVSAPLMSAPAPVVEVSAPLMSAPAPVVEVSAPLVDVPAPVVESPASPAETPTPVVQEKASISLEEPPPPAEEKSPVAVMAPAPTEAELASLRASLAKVETERDEAINHLEGVRADVDAIRQAQTTAQTQAIGLKTDLRAARTRIGILEKNLQTGQDQAKRDSAVITDLDSRVHDAMDAARHCGETLVGSEGRARTAAAEIVRLQQETQNLSQSRDGFKGQLAEREATLTTIQNQLMEREETLTKVQGLLQERESTLTTIQNQLTEREETLTKTQGLLQEREATLITTKNQLEEREETLTKVQGLLQERESTLTTIQIQLAEREETLTKAQGLLQDRESTLTITKNQLAEREEILAKVQRQVQDQESILTTLKDQLAMKEAQTTQLRLDLDGVTKERDDTRIYVAALETAKTGTEEALEKAKQELVDLNTRHTDLEDRYGQLTATLAPMDGGTLDAKTARAQAADAYDRYRVLWEKHLGHSRDSTELLTQVEQARHDLFVAQYRVMRAIGGGELYIVRPRDSLSDLARLASRDGSRWGEVREANAHLLTKTGPLLVGTSLVVP